jgi:chromosome segregation ATPase
VVETTDLTVEILREIRDEVRALNGKLDDQSQRFEARFDDQNQRFEVIETVLRDLAQQLVILGRGVKTLIQQRGPAADRVDALETRIAALEPRVDELERTSS